MSEVKYGSDLYENDNIKMLSKVLLKEAMNRDIKMIEEQCVEAVIQAITSGDFVRHVCGDKSAVSYLPYNGITKLKTENEALQSKLDKAVEIINTLKTLEHHSISEEIWRLDELLEKIRRKE